jgi:hypothetical protein
MGMNEFLNRVSGVRIAPGVPLSEAKKPLLTVFFRKGLFFLQVFC